MLNRLLPTLLLTLLTATTLSAQEVEARFSTEKTNYLAGEPVFAVLTVSNQGSKSIWLDFKSPDLPKLVCNDFAVEVPGAESAHEQWGCGFAGSCGRGLSEVPPGKSVSVRQLVNREFRLRPGSYTVHAHTLIVVHNQNLFDSSQVEQLAVSDALRVEVQRSSQDQLKAAFRPIVGELDSPDPMRRGEAAGAIMELAPPFLEDVLIELTKTSYASAAITALRKADTLKTRDALAQIATGSGDSMLRMQAIRNLGRTGDRTYLPALLRLMESTDKEILNAAAEAAGNLGGAAAVKKIAALTLDADADTRVAGAKGLGATHARQAVPVLIGLLVDSHPNVRIAASSSLFLLTHRIAFDGNEWADLTTPEAAAAVHQRWVQWWKAHASVSEIHGMADCASAERLD